MVFNTETGVGKEDTHLPFAGMNTVEVEFFSDDLGSKIYATVGGENGGLSRLVDKDHNRLLEEKITQDSIR